MLIRFLVENFLSFKERQIFSMAAGKHTRHKNHVINITGKRLLKSSIFFGANAAGKSNLIKAIDFGKKIALLGIDGGLLLNKHFRIDPVAINKPGIFQYDILSNGHIYSYGFALSYVNNTIVAEWLYLCDDNKEICIFERDENKNITTELKFKESGTEARFLIYSEDVPRNKTFLSEIIEHDLEEYEDFQPFFDIKDWFSALIAVFPETHFSGLEKLVQNFSANSLAEMMRHFDTGIEMIKGVEKNIDEVFSFLPEKDKVSIINQLAELLSMRNEYDYPEAGITLTVQDKQYKFWKRDNDIVATRMLMDHGNSLDLFDYADESDGTQRLFDLLPIFLKGQEEYVILIDELDRSFHTKLTIEFIEMFFSITDGRATQLIASVHDSNIMDLDLLRQDEIWFVERQADHSSHIYSLNKFNARFDKKVAKDYLLGRYDSISCFGQINMDKTEKVGP